MNPVDHFHKDGEDMNLIDRKRPTSSWGYPHLEEKVTKK